MSEELVLANPTATTVTAQSPQEFGGLQSTVLGWAEKKWHAAQQEHAELDQAWKEAKARKWKHTAIQSAANKALKRVYFYEKIVSALKAGYMLFPTVDDADVIAIRTRYDSNTERQVIGANAGSPALHEVHTEAPPEGDGEWKSPWQRWFTWGNRTINQGTPQQREVKDWETVCALEDAEFPVSMARPEIIQATTAAMEQKFFDEIRIFPFKKRRGDPIILGTVVGPGPGWSRKRVYFMIGWRVNETDF